MENTYYAKPDKIWNFSQLQLLPIHNIFSRYSVHKSTEETEQITVFLCMLDKRKMEIKLLPRPVLRGKLCGIACSYSQGDKCTGINVFVWIHISAVK